ncbi:MAG: flagellar protein FliT [Gammaproteobacteria bacterium]
MTDAARQLQLAELHAASVRMLKLAQAGDWVSVSQLQEQQQALAERLFAEPVDAADAAAVADMVKTVMDINAQISDLGRKAREGCLVKAGEQQLRRHAMQQYTKNSR